jgi:uncharacterized protein YjbI with pentapeptide repeats
MANPEHLEILKQGVKVWNKWSEKDLKTRPDLRDADLNYMNLTGAILREADLSGAYLNHAILRNSNLRGADLSYAELNHADLREVDLSQANRTGEGLIYTILSSASLSHAGLSYADLSDASIGGTIFVAIDLSEVKGLESVKHEGPSTIGIDTIYKSGGNIPEKFLRGCGLSDWHIESIKLNRPDLSNEEITNILYRVHDLRAHQAIQINPLFISYSHTDRLFIDEIENYLNEKGIRFWRDIHDATAGRLERQVDRAIRLNPTVLLVLSKRSVQSDWVQHEARLARKLEVETGRDVLCPIALDDSWKDCKWPARLREQIMEYNILDFSEWRDEDKFRRTFGRLVDGLDLFYK